MDYYPTEEEFQSAIFNISDCDEIQKIAGKDALPADELIEIYTAYRVRLFEEACKIMERNL